MDWIDITSFGLYLFGTFGFGAMFLFRVFPSQQERQCPAGHPTEYVILGISVVWFSLNLLLLCLAYLEGVDRLPFQLVVVAIQFAFPGMVMQLIFNDVNRPDSGLRPWRWRPWYYATYVASLAIYLWLLAVLFTDLPGRNKIGMVIGLGSGVLFGLTAVFSMTVMHIAAKGRKKPETTQERAIRRSMAVLFGVMIVFVVVLVVESGGAANFGRFLRMVGSSMPLLFIFTSLYHENRFGFVDLVVKRGTALMATFFVLVAWFAFVFPLLESFRATAIGNWISAAALVPLAVILPLLYARLNRWIDSFWLGRRFTLATAVHEFLVSLQSATGEEELVEQGEQGLGRIFQAPTRIDLELREAPNDDFAAAFDLPIRVDGDRIGAIRMGRRANHVPYLSEDHALLESLADVFASMLLNVRLQGKRREQERREEELSHQASLSELKALRAQINPHFLFNALNAIAGLIHEDPLAADRTVEQLAEVFRYTLRGSEKEWARVEDEFDFVTSYLDVEQARFGERLQVAIRVSPEARSVLIPTMVVQTLVENAVKHGVAKVRGVGTIDIEARCDADRLVIEVADNGPGPAADAAGPRRGEGFGVRSIRERFQGYFGDRASLVLARDDDRQLTVARIVLPRTVTDDRDGHGTGSAGVA